MKFDMKKGATDTAYVAVGAGVLALQQLQSQATKVQEKIDAGRVFAAARVSGLSGEVTTRVETLTADTRTRIDPILDQAKARFEPVVTQFNDVPTQLAGLVELGRDRVKTMTGRTATAA
jgi:hypothetical protein